MHLTPLLHPVCIAAVLAVPWSALRGADVRDEHVNPTKSFGKDATYKLVGDTTFGWMTGTIVGDIDLNGHAFVIDTGGGNRTVFSGAILGKGSFEWNGGGVPQVAPSILTGDKPNTFQGAFTLSRGVLDLDKPAGRDAIPGDLIVGKKGDTVVRLQRSNQINDAAHVTLGGPGISGLDLRGHDEKFTSLMLKTHAEISMGETPAALVIGDSSALAWDLTRTMTVRGFKPGKDRLVFGTGDSGLTKAQLARIGFASPARLAGGLYTAKAGSDGQLAPDTLVQAVNPPFDVSPQSIAARARLYEVPGLTALTGRASPLKDGMTIAFFGDSITWQNGFIGAIDQAIGKSEGTRGRSVKLVNRGINGGGVLQVRDGVTNSAYPGNSAQKPFAELIAGDRADVAVVFIGINDVWWRKTSPEVFENALRALAASVKVNRTRLVLATLTVRDELPDGRNSDDARIDHYAELTRKVARDTGATLVDLRKAFIGYLQNNNAQLRVDGTLHFKTSGVLTYDGVHPTAKGNELLADLISDGIVRALALEKPAAVHAPLIPGARFDYSKFAFQPKSWERRGLSLQLTPWKGTDVIESVEPLLTTSGLSFLDLFTMATGVGEKVSRIKDANGKTVNPANQPVRYATAMLRLRRENGGDAWVKRFFHELASASPSPPSTRAGALNQGWNWLLASSVAAQKDLCPVFAGDWKLPNTDETRAALGKVDWKKDGLTLKEVAAMVIPVWRTERTPSSTSSN